MASNSAHVAFFHRGDAPIEISKGKVDQTTIVALPSCKDSTASLSLFLSDEEALVNLTARLAKECQRRKLTVPEFVEDD